MFIDRLEPRRLMSVAAADVVSGFIGVTEVRNAIRLSKTGTLFVNGGPLSEEVRVHYRPNGRVVVDLTYRGVDVEETRRSASFKRSEIKRIQIDAGAGDDVVSVEVAELTRASTIYGGLGDDELSTTGVNTQLFGESGNDTLISDQEPVLTRIGPSGDVAVPINERHDLVISASYNALYGGKGIDVFRTYGGEDSLFGGSGEDVFEPLAGNVERFGLGDTETIPTIRFMSDINVIATRVGTLDVDLMRPGLSAPVYESYWSLRESTFTPISVVEPGAVTAP